MLIILIILIIAYFGLKKFVFKDKKITEVEYTIEDNIKVKEKKLAEYIYYEINIDDNTFAFKTNKSSGNYLIKQILHKKIDDYICIYPLFKNNTTSDILCMKDNIIYPYKTIKGSIKEIDEYVNSIEEYKLSNEEEGENVKKDSITIYKDNIKQNAYIALENYKGLYLINKKDVLKKIDLFEKDIYKKDLSTFYKNKYVVADYNKNYTFHEIYLIDIKTGKKTTIAKDEEMNFDSYIMGSANNKIYIFDKSEKEQYAINLKNNTIAKSGNQKKGISYYTNGELKTISIYDALNNKKIFNEYQIEDDKLNYSRVDLVNDNYYLYEKADDHYNVYKTLKENKDIKTFIFKTTDIDDIVYVDNDIYYINQNELNYYNEQTGSRIVLKNKELEYNKTIKFGVFYS